MARVTLVVNNADEGAETFLHALAGHLGAAGHDVTVHALIARGALIRTGGGAGFGGAAISRALPPGRSVGFAPSVARLAATNPAVLGVARRAVQLFGRGSRAARAAAQAAPLVSTRPDVVHLAFSGIGVGLVDALDLLEPDVRVVVSCRGSGELVAPVLDPDIRAPLARVLSRADAVHAVAGAVAAAAVGWGADPDRVRVIRPAVDVDRVELRPPGRGTSGNTRLVTVSRLHWVKSIGDQIDAVSSLTRRGRAVTLDVVGDGPERIPLEFRAHASGVADRVRFHGATSPEDVRCLLREADVYLSSSLSEGTSNSVLEAMAAGVPVVATPAGGMVELLVDGANSMVVPVGDAGSLADAVERLVSDPDLADSIGAGGRRTVRDSYTMEHQAAEVASLYADVLAGRSWSETRS